MPTGAAGTTLTLDAIYQDGTGTAVEPTTPLVDIIDPLSVTVINNAVPTIPGQTGRREYAFAIPLDAPLGAWTAHWTGLVNGANVEADEVFQVVDAGEIVFDPIYDGFNAPCSPWVNADEVQCCVDADPAQAARAVAYASLVMWALSGRQYGCCSLSFRPCKRDCNDPSDSGPWGARLRDGNWISLSCRSCSGPCACSEVCEVRFPNAPVCGVSQVIMDGVNVGDGWWIEDREWLVLGADVGCFPTCQDMSLPLGEVGTWGIKYTYGSPIPVGGEMAAEVLVCEILKGMRNDSTCCLPKRTQLTTKNGIPIALLDPMSFFDNYRTGIYEIDLFLTAVNPQGRPSGARIISPDSEPRSRMEWP